MSDLKYLSGKKCSCCGTYLNIVNKTCIRRINDENTLLKINSVKNTILTNKKKQTNTPSLKVGDVVCGSCRSYASKYGTIEKSSSILPTITTTRSLPTTTITPGPSTSRGK